MTLSLIQKHRLLAEFWAHQGTDARPLGRSEELRPSRDTLSLFEFPLNHFRHVGGAGWDLLRSAVEQSHESRERLLARPSLRGVARNAVRMSGRFLLYDPAGSLFDAMGLDSLGFFDESDCPGWDSWLSVNSVSHPSQLPVSRSQLFAHHLVCWVPDWIVETVNDVVECTTGSALLWADDASATNLPVVRELSQLGLLD